jgi:ubiquinone/menaquinone biosynthesis C-methylase UbiE
MAKDRMRAEWAAFAAEWIRIMQRNGDASREGLLDDWMLRLCGDVDGKRVIDLGCGEGRFCRMLAARGASVLGVDLQPEFIRHAQAQASPNETYLLGDIEELADVPDSEFDLAVSYISLVDVADQRAAMHQAYRVLKPGGRMAVCNLSPMATAARKGPWLRDESRVKLHYVLDDYADEGPRLLPFAKDHSITNMHRMLSTTIRDFLEPGFRLEALHEPVPTPEQMKQVPKINDLARVPIFTIYELRK